MKGLADTVPVAHRTISIVIPTFQRRSLVTRAVRALTRLHSVHPKEVIVVVDGSTDGTTEALERLETSFRLVIHTQPNLGAAAARNAGASLATGEILLFLDDDMFADPDLLAEHLASHEAGAGAVFGDLRLAPDSPDNFLSRAVGRWTDERLARLSRSDEAFSLFDLLTGQLSVSREIFLHVGGFDENFTSGGTFGGEDLDLGCALIASGTKIIFNPRAISYQYYSVSYLAHLTQWFQTGLADVRFARKRPDRADELFMLHGVRSRRTKYLLLPLARSRRIVSFVRRVALALSQTEPRHRLSEAIAKRAFFIARDLCYWRGVYEAGGIPGAHPVVVLCYHSISDLSNDPILAPFGVPLALFREHLEDLAEQGFRFISGEEFIAYLNGQGGVPRRALLLTFDDCYDDLGSVAREVLHPRGIPALAFAVAEVVGRSNEWDQRLGATRLPLLDWRGLRELHRYGIEVGAHSGTHSSLTALTREMLDQELARSAHLFAAHGLDHPRFFAYPYGEHGTAVRARVREGGYAAAFALSSARFTRGMDGFAIPRVEVLARDRGLRLLLKVQYPRSYRIAFEIWWKLVRACIKVQRAWRRVS